MAPPATPPLPLRFIARVAVTLWWVAAGMASVHFGAREAVASAVALAPNASGATELREPMALPAALLERGAERRTVRTGITRGDIVFWNVPARHVASPKATILLLHGIRMDKSSLVPVGLALSDAGYRAVLVDLRGHGESAGRYLTYGAAESHDLSTLLDGLGERRNGTVGAYGFSYGAAVTIELSARDPRIGAIVAVAPFSSLRGVTLDYERKYLPSALQIVPDAWFQSAVDVAGERAEFDPDRAVPSERVRESSAHLLLVHGTADTQVPPRHSLAIAQAAGELAERLEIPHATHADMPADATGAIRRATVAWFDRWLVTTE
jgi:pimeloyl-ACP methyl ester carboxylesterase